MWDTEQIWTPSSALTAGSLKKLTVPDAALWLGSIDACRDVIQEGFGWSILPKICLTEFQGNLAPMTFQDGTPFLRHTYALISHGESTAPHVQAFLEALMTYHKILFFLPLDCTAPFSFCKMMVNDD